MKKLILTTALLSTFTVSTLAQVNFPSFSNSDFDRMEQTAKNNAVEAAMDYAQAVGVELVELRKSSRNSRYTAVTNTDCQFSVKVGLLFKANVVSQSACE